MAGYTRQSVADILNGENVTAPPLNAEFNRLQGAFNHTTGHLHDGSAGSAPKINLATSVTGYLSEGSGGVGGKNSVSQTSNPTQTDDANDGYAVGSIWINVTAGKIFQCLGNALGAAVWHELTTFNAQGHIIPSTSGVKDLGSTSYAFRDIHLFGTAYAANLNGALGGTTPASVTGTSITATSAFYGDLTGDVTGNVAGTTTGIHVGDIYADNGTSLILQNGADGTGAAFTGSVTGSLIGNAAGSHTGTFTGTVDGNSVAITNVGTPVENTDGANKEYVLNQLSLGVNSVDQFRTDAQDLAIRAEDSQYTISTGVSGYSALHYAAKAAASQIASASSETNAASSQSAAANSALIAQQKAGIVSNAVDALERPLIGALI